MSRVPAGSSFEVRPCRTRRSAPEISLDAARRAGGVHVGIADAGEDGPGGGGASAHGARVAHALLDCCAEVRATVPNAARSDPAIRIVAVLDIRVARFVVRSTGSTFVVTDGSGYSVYTGQSRRFGAHAFGCRGTEVADTGGRMTATGFCGAGDTERGGEQRRGDTFGQDAARLIHDISSRVDLSWRAAADRSSP